MDVVKTPAPFGRPDVGRAQPGLDCGLAPEAGTTVPSGNLRNDYARVLDERARAIAQLSSLFTQAPVLPPPNFSAAHTSAEVVIEEARRNRDEARENEITPQGLVRSRTLDLAPFEKAAGHYSADLAGGLKRWVSTHSREALSLGVQLITAAVAAVASGGASLAVDGPKLAAASLAIASEVLRESGISLDRVVGDVFCASLQALGVDEAVARKWGDTLAATTGAALELTLFFTSKGQHRMDASRFGTLAAHLAADVGADKAIAALIASTATGLAALGIALAQGDALASEGSARSLWQAATRLGGSLQQGLSGGTLDPGQLLAEGTEVHARFQAFLSDVDRDTGVKDFWGQLGTLSEKAVQAALASLMGGANERSYLQA